MPGVIVRAAFHLARTHRQQRLGPIEGLDLRFLVDTQHHGMLRRIHVQPHDAPDFLDQQRIGRELERLRPMRLQAECVPKSD